MKSCGGTRNIAAVDRVALPFQIAGTMSNAPVRGPFVAYSILSLWALGLSPALLLVVAPCSPAAQIAQPEPDTGIAFMIVVTGGELLTGAYPDSHTHFLTRTLRPLGLHCAGSITVDDQGPAITQALRFAASQAQLILVTGGLGPTTNDVTRQSLADFSGIALRESPDVLQTLVQRTGKPAPELPANLRRQAMVPSQGGFLPNANGTAAGLLFDSGNQVIVALPGPPRELEPMVRNELLPRLERRFGVHSPGCSLLARFAGIGQSGIDQILKQHALLPDDIIVQSQFEGRRVDFTFLLPHDRPEDRARLEQLKAGLILHLGDFIYAFDNTSLEQLLLANLQKAEITLALAEVATGGALAASLAGENAAPQVIPGAFSAPTEAALARILHLPGPEWAQAASAVDRLELLASAARRDTGSQCALVVGAPVPGQAPEEQSVPIALQREGAAVELLQLPFRGPVYLARSGLLTQLLGELRKRFR